MRDKDRYDVSQNDSVPYDVEINGLRFLSAASVNQPYQRALAKVLRSQMDNNQNPDSNSLAGWWIRGQGDWSAGAGREYQEPPTDMFASRQFDSSSGIDPFTDPGFITLLPKAVKVGSFDSASEAFMTSTGSGKWVASGSKFFRVDGSELIEITGVTGTVTGLIVAGRKIVVFTSTGAFMCDPDADTAVPAFTTKKGALTGAWVKQRLMIAQNNTLFEQTIPETVVDLDTQTPIFTSSDPNYHWSSFASAPTAILISGYGLSGSEIWALRLDESGKLPDVGVPVSVAEFPANERVEHLRVYLGAFLAVGTNKGVRVGNVTTSQVSLDLVSYGPLLDSPVPTGDMTTFDRFVMYPSDEGLVKVDLSLIDDDGRAAWATFVRSEDSGHEAAVIDDHRDSTFATRVNGVVSVYRADDSNGVDAGWIQGSWVRYGTLERKNFVDLTVITEPEPHGVVTVMFSDDEGMNKTLGVLEGQESTFIIGLPYTMADGAVRLEIAPDDQGRGPKVNSWSLRALPTPKGRSELVQLILNNYDFERDTHGVTVGYEGRASQRWNYLLKILQDGATVPVTELASGMNYKAMCEDLSFTQTSPPTSGSGFGGTLAITLRVVG